MDCRLMGVEMFGYNPKVPTRIEMVSDITKNFTKSRGMRIILIRFITSFSNLYKSRAR